MVVVILGTLIGCCWPSDVIVGCFNLVKSIVKYVNVIYIYDGN